MIIVLLWSTQQQLLLLWLKKRINIHRTTKYVFCTMRRRSYYHLRSSESQFRFLYGTQLYMYIAFSVYAYSILCTPYLYEINIMNLQASIQCLLLVGNHLLILLTDISLNHQEIENGRESPRRCSRIEADHLCPREVVLYILYILYIQYTPYTKQYVDIFVLSSSSVRPALFHYKDEKIK